MFFDFTPAFCILHKFPVPLSSIQSNHQSPIHSHLKKTFFASDLHLGVDARLSSRERERQFVRWLETVAPEAEAIYLIGDLFEFWFEYRYVTPRGHTRLLGALARLSDAGLPIYAFTGNHDLWMFGYFEAELGIPVYKKDNQRDIGGKQ